MLEVDIEGHILKFHSIIQHNKGQIMTNKHKFVSGLLLMWASFNAAPTLAETAMPVWAVNPPQGTASYCVDILFMGEKKGIQVAKAFASNKLNTHELAYYVEGTEGINSSTYNQDVFVAKAGLQNGTKIIKQYVHHNDLCVLVAGNA